MTLSSAIKTLPCLTRLSLRGVFRENVRCLSGGRRGGRISESSVFLQSGHKISELPVVVRKVRDVWDFYNKMGLDDPDKLPEAKHLDLLPTGYSVESSVLEKMLLVFCLLLLVGSQDPYS